MHNSEKETKKEVKPVKQSSGKSKKKGLTAKELVDRHISDKNDVITEEEFKNLVIDVDITSDVAHEPLDISVDPDRPKDEDKDPKIATPWDVIN